MTDYDEMRGQLSLLPDEDLISILRVRDEEEWRPEVFDIVKAILRDRGVSPDLISDEAVDELNGLNLVTVGQYTSEVEAETDRLALAAQGLNAWIMNPEDGSESRFLLQVLPGNEAASMKILIPETALAPDDAEVFDKPPCPECGSKDVVEGANHSNPPHSTDSASDYVWFYLCRSCGCKWAQRE